MTFKVFITGTDTNIGKTYISVGLLQAFNRLNYTTLGLKPIATGCVRHRGKLINDDATQLQKSSSIKLDYDLINPFAFEPAIAPHIAAQKAAVPLNAKIVIDKLEAVLSYPADIKIIEGVGGWYVPLNHKESLDDVVSYLKLPVILVVGIRLGCLNHAILTSKAIRSANLKLIGWVANSIDPMMIASNENINTLTQWLNAPCLGVIDYQQNPLERLDISPLLS